MGMPLSDCFTLKEKDRGWEWGSVDLLRSRGPATEPLMLSVIQFNKIGTWDYCQELIICNL